MSAYSGRQGKGAAKTRRAQKRAEAEARNWVFVRVYACGHKHSERTAAACWNGAQA